MYHCFCWYFAALHRIVVLRVVDVLLSQIILKSGRIWNMFMIRCRTPEERKKRERQKERTYVAERKYHSLCRASKQCTLVCTIHSAVLLLTDAVSDDCNTSDNNVRKVLYTIMPEEMGKLCVLSFDPGIIAWCRATTSSSLAEHLFRERFRLLRRRPISM